MEKGTIERSHDDDDDDDDDDAGNHGLGGKEAGKEGLIYRGQTQTE